MDASPYSRYDNPRYRTAQGPRLRPRADGSAGSGGGAGVGRSAGQAASRSAGRASRSGQAGVSWGAGAANVRLVTLVAAIALAVFLLAAVIQAANLYAEGLAGGDGSAEGAIIPAQVVGGDDTPVSTPRSEWREGALPFLYQTDPAWADAPYAGATVAESGCGPTSLAMVYVALTGRTDFDPATLADFSERNGFVEEGLTAWRFMTDGALRLGLSSHEVPADAARLRAELAAGNPVICSVRPGDFTETGHFLVVAGVADNGELVIHDPNSPANSARTWDIDRVLSQCANLWAFERA